MSTATILRSRAAIEQRGKRGDKVILGQAEGLYVGTTPSGQQYLAWEGEDFDTVCQAFDARGVR